MVRLAASMCHCAMLETGCVGGMAMRVHCWSALEGNILIFCAAAGRVTEQDTKRAAQSSFACDRFIDFSRWSWSGRNFTSEGRVAFEVGGDFFRQQKSRGSIEPRDFSFGFGVTLWQM